MPYTVRSLLRGRFHAVIGSVIDGAFGFQCFWGKYCIYVRNEKIIDHIIKDIS